MEPYIRNVFYYETDRMSIVHNSNYLRIFEEARLDHLAKSGVDYEQMEQGGVLIPQNEAHVKYNKTLAYGDTMKIYVRLVKFNGIVMKYEYELFRNDEDKPAASGWTSHCFLNDRTRFPLSIKKCMPEVYEKMLASVEA